MYVYEPDGSGGWAETRLTASDASGGAGFGSAVDVDGDRIVVGTRFDDENQEGDVDTAYVFEPDGSGGWAETKLTSPIGDPLAEFGASVGVSGDRLVIGSPLDREHGFESGAIWIAEQDESGWILTKVTASDAAAYDWFGREVAIFGDRVVAGRWNDDFGPGSVYLYEPDAAGRWAESRVADPDAGEGGFGASVDVTADRLVVGAPYGDVAAPSGSAYVFTSTETPADADGDGVLDADDVCAGTDLSEPAPPRLQRYRYWTDENGAFVDKSGRASRFDIEDTAGCSASQIIAAAHLGRLHTRYGLGPIALFIWVLAHR